MDVLFYTALFVTSQLQSCVVGDLVTSRHSLTSGRTPQLGYSAPTDSNGCVLPQSSSWESRKVGTNQLGDASGWEGRNKTPLLLLTGKCGMKREDFSGNTEQGPPPRDQRCQPWGLGCFLQAEDLGT